MADSSQQKQDYLEAQSTLRQLNEELQQNADISIKRLEEISLQAVQAKEVCQARLDAIKKATGQL